MRKHYNSMLHNSDLEQQKNDAPRKRFVPKDLRQKAMVSRDGGRGQCRWCKTSFTVTYLTMCRTATFGEPDWACADCRKEKGLTRA
jgi:hypothetical protein